jgi:hypothetical protein
MKEYLIKKGKHYPSGFHLGLTFTKYIDFECMFSEDCLYDMEGVDKFDINKLYGFTTTFYHHRQSARVGWRCIDGENIQIVTYSYNDGFREPHECDILGVVKPNEKFRCGIVDLETSYLYTFKMNDGTGETTFFHDAKKPDWFFFHYLLFPYFGGNKTAPHDMVIYINKL